MNQPTVYEILENRWGKDVVELLKQKDETIAAMKKLLEDGLQLSKESSAYIEALEKALKEMCDALTEAPTAEIGRQRLISAGMSPLAEPYFNARALLAKSRR